MQSYFVVSAESYKSLIVFKTMTYILFAFQLCMLVLLLRYLPFFEESSLSFFERAIFLGIKVGFGVLLIAIYARFYPQRNLADVFKYFDDANIIYQNAKSASLSLFHFITGICFDRNSQESNTLLQFTHHVDKQGSGLLEANHLLVIRLNILLRFISLGNIYIHSLWFSFFSFTGCVGIYRAFNPYFEKRKWLLKMPLFILPSLLFWGSGLLKESLVMLCIGLIVFQLDLAAFKKWNYQKTGVVFIFTIILWFLKPFIVLSLLLAYLIACFYKSRFKWLLLALPIAFSLFGNSISNSLLAKRNEYTQLAINTNTGSLLDNKIVKEEGVIGLLKLAPAMLKAILLSPLHFSFSQKNELPFSVENIAFILLLIFTFTVLIRRNFVLPKAMVFIFFFAMFQLIVIGFSVPVAGAIVRYKITAMPFLWIIGAYIIDLVFYKYE